MFPDILNRIIIWGKELNLGLDSSMLDHQIIKVGGTLRGLHSNLLLKARSVGRSERVAEGFVHLGLENLQGWKQFRPLLCCLTVVMGRAV